MSQATFDGFDDYERRKERARAQQAEQSRKGRDVGPLPKVPPRGVLIKERCRHSLREFLEFFLRPIFRLEWSPDHLEAIKTLEDVFLNGGQFAYAMPRGNGKTSLCIGATTWASVYGHRRFIVPICATGPAAERFLESVKTIIETNARIAKVFPEVVHPIAALEGINNRAAGQTLGGERTRIKWTGKRIILPTVADSPASGVIVHAAGLLGSVRGLSQAAADDDVETDDDWWESTEDLDAAFEPEIDADGGMIRPDAAILDDPQTDESAKNPAQTQKRLQTINKAVLNLAGPDRKIAAVCPCTVIQPDDLADQLLDRERNAEWRGRRTRLLASMPDADVLKLWHKYKEVREESLRKYEDIREATDYYRDNRDALSAGVVASWPQRFEAEHVDAIQYAIERWCKSEEAFFAEYQNEPRLEQQDGIERLQAKELLSRCDGSERGQVPDWADRVTAFVDIQQDVLPWMVCAWGADLRGRIIDYGGWPKQARQYYTLREVSPTLREATGSATVEAGIEIGLRQLAEWVFAQRWASEDGTRSLACEWFGVDANWPISTQIVYQASREWQGKLQPFHGRFVGAASLPMDKWKRKPGSRAGHFWLAEWQNGIRTLAVDSNSWKTLVAKRLQAEPDRGIGWFGDQPHRHRMLVDQLAAEYGVRVVGRGRKVDEWKNQPGRDNHWWDCLVGCAVGASVKGMPMVGGKSRPKRKRRSLKALQDEALARRNG